MIADDNECEDSRKPIPCNSLNCIVHHENSKHDMGEGESNDDYKSKSLISASSTDETMYTEESKRTVNSKVSQLFKFYFFTLIVPSTISMWYISGTFFPPEARANAPFLLWSQGYMKRNDDDGQLEVCPYAAVCARGLAQVILIGLSRLTAFASYPALALTFVTKMHSFIHILSSTYLSTIVPFESLHDVHKTSGKIYGWLALCHTIAHHLRYLLRRDIDQYRTKIYISGLVAILSIGLITLNMSSFTKKCLSFEVRFNAHWLFLLMIAALCFHSERTRIFVLTLL